MFQTIITAVIIFNLANSQFQENYGFSDAYNRDKLEQIHNFMQQNLKPIVDGVEKFTRKAKDWFKMPATEKDQDIVTQLNSTTVKIYMCFTYIFCISIYINSFSNT